MRVQVTFSSIKIHLLCKSIVKTLHYFQGMESQSSLSTLDTIHRHFFVTRLIINKINKVQWVDFKLENVLVSLHSLKKQWASAPLYLRNGELLGHSPIRKVTTIDKLATSVRKLFTRNKIHIYKIHMRIQVTFSTSEATIIDKLSTSSNKTIQNINDTHESSTHIVYNVSNNN